MKEVTEEGCVGTINFSDGRLHHHLFPHIEDSNNKSTKLDLVSTCNTNMQELQ